MAIVHDDDTPTQLINTAFHDIVCVYIFVFQASSKCCKPFFSRSLTCSSPIIIQRHCTFADFFIVVVVVFVFVFGFSCFSQLSMRTRKKTERKIRRMRLCCLLLLFFLVLVYLFMFVYMFIFFFLFGVSCALRSHVVVRRRFLSHSLSLFYARTTMFDKPMRLKSYFLCC